MASTQSMFGGPPQQGGAYGPPPLHTGPPQQGGVYGAPPITTVPVNTYTYRSHLNQGVQLGAWVIGARMVVCMGFTGFMFIISGIINISIGSDFSNVNVIIGSVLTGVGSLLIIGAITLACIAYNSYKNTQVANPGQPFNPTGGAYIQGSSMYSGAGTSAYSSANTQGAGFSSQYNYSPASGGASHPPPPPGFSGQPGGSSYPPPPPAYTANQGIDPPAYDSSIPSAPKF